MTPPDWLEFYIIAIVHVGAVIAIGAPTDLNRTAWRATEVGRTVMAKWTSLAALFTLSVANYWWPFGGFFYVYAVVLTAVDASMLWQWRVMRRVNRRGAA